MARGNAGCPSGKGAGVSGDFAEGALSAHCELLETFGPNEVGLPHVRFLTGKLWEILMKGKSGIARAIYVAIAEKRIVVVHAFVKKSQKTPRAAIETALDRAKELSK